MYKKYLPYLYYLIGSYIIIIIISCHFYKLLLLLYKTFDKKGKRIIVLI